MKALLQLIEPVVQRCLIEHYDYSLPEGEINVTVTKPEFDGEWTIVTFPIAGKLKQSPVNVGQAIGRYLVDHVDFITDYNVVKGFLNLTMHHSYWLRSLKDIRASTSMVSRDRSGLMVVEYASPNTNKPLHLGHLRNILLGWSVGQLLSAIGHDIHYTQVINDRGIAICKSMVSYERFFSGQTPNSSGMKPDHFIGEVYVRFNDAFEEEYAEWQQSEAGERVFLAQSDQPDRTAFFKKFKNEYFNQFSSLGAEATQLLEKWEQGDPETRDLWSQLNDWFMEGYQATYRRLGIHFDSEDLESETYLIGKDIVQDGLDKGDFTRENDGSVWVDLSDIGLDKKLLLRSNGTSVYITQDLGTADQRYKRLRMDGMIYTVGNEQEYHFKVLFAILQKIGAPYADQLFHLSYGMVELPEGRMKTREGNVVDADDLIDEVYSEVSKNSEARGELDLLNDEKRSDIYEKITMGAIKYYLLRVDARKNMQFNPQESVDLQGQTGPYIQNAYVRIKSLFRKVEEVEHGDYMNTEEISQEAIDLIILLQQYDDEVHQAAVNYDPAILAQYLYQLARHYHRFYQSHRILQSEPRVRSFRLELSRAVADHLEHGMTLLGIEMPERM